MISFIMPAKNVSKYIQDTLDPFLEVSTSIPWELLIIDDHSSDDTAEIIERKIKKNRRIRYFKNIGEGKVAGLNYGYSIAKGNIIKCIDSDDVTHTVIIDILSDSVNYDAHCHDYNIVNEKLEFIGRYRINKKIIVRDYVYVAENLLTLPRCTWSFNREIADKIFPIPAELPFEDVWFSLIIKSNAKNIKYLPEAFYDYRQHSNQTFGGILNFSKETINFRANRLLDLLNKFENHKDRLGINSTSIFERAKTYYRMLQGDFNFWKILVANLDFVLKLKLLVICYVPSLAAFLIKVKWKFS